MNHKTRATARLDGASTRDVVARVRCNGLSLTSNLRSTCSIAERTLRSSAASDSFTPNATRCLHPLQLSLAALSWVLMVLLHEPMSVYDDLMLDDITAAPHSSLL